MKISYNWLKTLCNVDITAEEAARVLTAVGLEAEGIEKHESVKGGLKGVVTGRVLTCEQHPNADRLRVTTVDTGSEAILSIVCGAPNVAAGQTVLVATIGTVLHPVSGEPLKIAKSKIRGVASEGMICAEDELGIGNSHDGILILPEGTPVGIPAAEYLKFENDYIIEIGLTPNRGDAASHLGVARDLVAALNCQLQSEHYTIKLPEARPLPEPTGTSSRKIFIEANDACKRYAGMIISGITVSESPDWLKQRLLSAGVRPISNIVDITNFVMLETGQPLHAFDNMALRGEQVTVRYARDGEKLITLDGVERTLSASDLVIADEHAPVCLAGLFGGQHSGVHENTAGIFLESAFFSASAVRRTASHHGIRSDASFRFERGTDPEMTVFALQRAAALILEIAGGTVSMGLSDVYPERLEPFKVAFSYLSCTKVIGREIDKGTIKRILAGVGIEIEIEGADGLLLRVPRFKSDVTREIDVIEEVLRIYGYDHVDPARAIHYTAVSAESSGAITEKISRLLESAGFNEIMGVSLTRGADNSSANAVKLVNPLSSDLDVMRQDMLDSGLSAVSYNVNRRNENLRFFEAGNIYMADTGTQKYTERPCISILVTGDLFEKNPYGLKQQADFAFLKSCVSAVLQKAGCPLPEWNAFSNDRISSGMSFTFNGKEAGHCGSVAKALLRKSEISQPVYYACLYTDVIGKKARRGNVRYEEIGRFPAVKRDLALLIDKQVQYAEIERIAWATEKKLLTGVQLFDIYEDPKLEGKKSYAVTFTLMDKDATLTDKQVDNVMQKLVSAYEQKLGAKLR